jgi:bifunctional N6-L-threonylcarbamoyladenine synthase / protein kinase Bud32
MKLIAQGAEAKIYESGEKIIKDRIKKGYRLPEIDQKLRRTRTRAEARLIRMADRAGISVPKILEVDDKKMKLEIEKISGSKVRDVLTPEMCKLIGKELLKMHKANIIHGDLTTSNMILRGKEVVLIDFGLAQYSERVEDKAVDIHLFKECLKSKHFDIWLSCWKHFLQYYKSKDILKRLEVVERRGKYKH